MISRTPSGKYMETEAGYASFRLNETDNWDSKV